MSIENVTTALQAFATTGNGETLVLREPRLVTFKVRGNGADGSHFVERAARGKQRSAHHHTVEEHG
jgi:hypothetical protein